MPIKLRFAILLYCLTPVVILAVALLMALGHQEAGLLVAVGSFGLVMVWRLITIAR